MKTKHKFHPMLAGFAGLILGLIAPAMGANDIGNIADLPQAKTKSELKEWLAANIAADKARDEAKAEAAAQASTDDGQFYTGKPYVSQLDAYAFRYRTYDPELQRWTTEDPSGFPDGPNASFYAPTPTSALDWMGLNVVHVNNSGAVLGAGHSGAYIGNDSTGYTYHSYGAASSSSSSGSSGQAYDTANGQRFATMADVNRDAAQRGYNRSQTWETTAEADDLARNGFDTYASDDYHLTDHNCAGGVKAALEMAGQDYAGDETVRPNSFFERNTDTRGNRRVE